jgi:hypothetical protein
VDTVGRYEIRIKGRMSDDVSRKFSEFISTVCPAETVLRCELHDQSELHGVLETIESLGLELVELRSLEQTRAH